MKKIITIAIPFAALLISSCSNDKNDTPPLIGTLQANAGNAKAAFQKAQAADQAGQTKKAADLYGKMADENPIAVEAPKARFRQAQLLEQLGRPVDAFEAYNDFSNKFPGSSQYSQAVSRQQAIAKSAADGNIHSGVLNSKIETSKVVKMHESLRDAAPQSSIASAAQFKIAELYQNEGKAPEAIAAYKKVVADYSDSSHAPEAQYRVGIILLEQAKRGNQDKGNLDRASESFHDYLNRYPNGSRASDARRQLSNLSAQDEQRSYEVAEFYRRKGDKESARFYYNEILKQQKSGSLHDKVKNRLNSL